MKNSTARDFGGCNPSRNQVGARHGVPLQGFFHTFRGDVETPSLFPEGERAGRNRGWRGRTSHDPEILVCDMGDHRTTAG